MMKNVFYFILKVLFSLKIFRFLSWHSWHLQKVVDEKLKVNFKNYDVITWETNNYNADNTQNVKAIRKLDLIEYNTINRIIM